MREMTESNIHSAFAGESQAHMRYLLFAERAEKAGFPNTARLFRAVAFAEKVHASNHYSATSSKGDFVTFSVAGFGSKTVSEDLEVAIEGETFEVNEMYPAYIAVAKLQDHRDALRSFTWALEAEKTHAELFKKARQAVDGGGDIKLGTMQVCSICGYTVEGEAPNRCPICGSPKNAFKPF
ncbi:MAG: rubrerythrin family protein [Candidatus Freyarchaeota archaeon]|nr:rubrerythrin family protein [Candidatus Jordarchaeia archaeon]